MGCSASTDRESTAAATDRNPLEFDAVQPLPVFSEDVGGADPPACMEEYDHHRSSSMGQFVPFVRPARASVRIAAMSRTPSPSTTSSGGQQRAPSAQRSMISGGASVAALSMTPSDALSQPVVRLRRQQVGGNSSVTSNAAEGQRTPTSAALHLPASASTVSVSREPNPLHIAAPRELALAAGFDPDVSLNNSMCSSVHEYPVDVAPVPTQ